MAVLLKHYKGSRKLSEHRQRINEVIIQWLRDHGEINYSGNPSQFHISNISQNDFEADAIEILHDLYRNRVVNILRTGANNMPLVSVTNYGRKMLNNEGPPIYDPLDYVREIRDNNPGLDPIVLEYVEEGINAFNRGCPKSAAIALGVASEQMILLLCDSLMNALSDPYEKKRLEQAKWQIKSKHDIMQEILRKKRKVFPAAFRDTYDVYLDAMFHLIRIHRNLLGHPTGVNVDNNIVHLFLKCFNVYLRKLYELKGFLDSNKI